MYKYQDAGLRNVWLVNGYTLKKTPYGKAVAVDDLEGLTWAICAALCRKPGRLTGAEFRYLRLHLRLSQRSLAKLLGNTEQAVALWERKGRIPLWADKLIRLYWAEREEGNEPIRKAMERLNVVERLVASRIVVEDTRRGWRSRVEEAKAA